MPHPSRISIALFLSVFLLLAVHLDPTGPQTTRYTDLTQSIVESRSFALRADHRVTADFFELSGKQYLAIPPGVSLLHAPVFWSYRGLMAAIGKGPDWEYYWPLYASLASLLTLLPLMAYLSVTFFRTLAPFTASLEKRLWLSFLLVLGSQAFFYSVKGIWAHAYAMAFLGLAFCWMVQERRPWWVGVATGLAAVVDFASVVPTVVLFAWLVVRRRNDLRAAFTDAAAFALGYVPFLMLILWFSFVVTGSPWVSPNQAFVEIAIASGHFDRASSIFGTPGIAQLWGLSFSPFRGIFLYFPMTFLSFWGTKQVLRDSRRELGIVCLAVSCSIFTFTASYYAWSGDSCFGPRHLTAAIPFLLFPVVFCSMRAIRIFGSLSFLVAWAGAHTNSSANVFTNLAIFLYRGPFLPWLDTLYRRVLPDEFGIHLYLVTPFFLYVGIGVVLYFLWRPCLASVEG